MAEPVGDTYNGVRLPERDVRADLLEVIRRQIQDHPRSAQKLIGPSEIGTPCTRKLGYKLRQVEHTTGARSREAAWRPTVGTAVHTWLQDAFTAENARLGWDRWVMEKRVMVGLINGVEIHGSCDLFDLLTGTVTDWKIPGPSSIKAKKSAKHPGATYRTQAHLYGRGFDLLPGYDVRTVSIMFLPSAGELGDHYYWSEPYDEQVAIDALVRAEAVQKVTELDNGMALLPAVNDYCHLCEWWQPGATDLSRACPGQLDLPKIDNSGPAFGPAA